MWTYFRYRCTQIIVSLLTGPFKNFPQLTVYHPQNSSNGHAFANIGWTGWIGSITGQSNFPILYYYSHLTACSSTVVVIFNVTIGFSVEQMAISEIGVTFPDDTFGDESRFGVPFTVS